MLGYGRISEARHALSVACYALSSAAPVLKLGTNRELASGETRLSETSDELTGFRHIGESAESRILSNIRKYSPRLGTRQTRQYVLNSPRVVTSHTWHYLLNTKLTTTNLKSHRISQITRK